MPTTTQFRSAPQKDITALSAIVDAGILAAIRVDSVDDGLKAAEALLKGGAGVCEVAMSSPRSTAILRAVLQRFGDEMLVGAGTVLSPEAAACCIHEGARFIVTPTLNTGTIAHCKRQSIPVIPGALTPTEILKAWERGADCVKVFPASAAGGPGFIRAINAPLPHLRLLPMGGVSVANAGEYIRAGALALGVGNDLINARKIATQDFNEIVERVRTYRRHVQEARSAVG